MNRLVWNIDKEDPMLIKIWNSNEDHDLNLPPSATIFLGEAMESAGREAVMQHIAEIDRSPWIRAWHADHTFKLLKR
jgi:hypothetical protein